MALALRWDEYGTSSGPVWRNSAVGCTQAVPACETWHIHPTAKQAKKKYSRALHSWLLLFYERWRGIARLFASQKKRENVNKQTWLQVNCLRFSTIGRAAPQLSRLTSPLENAHNRLDSKMYMTFWQKRLCVSNTLCYSHTCSWTENET